MPTYLFRAKDRTNSAPKTNTEGFFEHLDRSAHPPMKKLREFIETLLSEYPEGERNDLVKRLKNGTEDTAQSALFELIIHGILLRTGHKVIALEPSIKGSNKRPDFLVEGPTGQQFYLECLRYASMPANQKSKAAIENQLKEAINSIVCPYHLSVTLRGTPTKQPSFKGLKRELKAWVAGIDEGTCRETPEFIWKSDGLTFTAKVFSKSSDPAGRNIGAEIFEIQTLPVDGGLSRSLQVKMRKFGKLDKPLCVAITSPEIFVGQDELFNALFGSLAVVIHRNDPNKPASYIRQPDGIWWAGDWQYARCSAVLYFKNLGASAIGDREGILVHHPEATHPLGADALPVEQFRVVDGQISTDSKKQPLREVFDLKKSWPED